MTDARQQGTGRTHRQAGSRKRSVERLRGPGAPAAAFALALDQVPVPRQGSPARPPPPVQAPSVELLQAATSRDGVHLASLRVQDTAGGDLDLRVLMKGETVDVRIQVTDVHSETWIRGRVEAMQRALGESGLTLGSVDVGQQHAGSGEQEKSRHAPAGRDGERSSAGGLRRTGDGGWTL